MTDTPEADRESNASAEPRGALIAWAFYDWANSAFAGPLLVGWVTWLADSQRVGMGVIILFFLLGLLLMLTVPEPENAQPDVSP